jgi:hypothetical protein
MHSEEVKMNENRLAVCQSVWLPRVLITLIPVLTVLGTANRVVAQGGADMPLQFKMIGKFHDPDKEENAGGVNAFTVNVLKKTWIFDIESSYTLEGGALGSSVLKQIYPPIMTFMGPKELTDQLTNPEIEGKTYTLTGQLYMGKRLFRVNTIEGPPEESEGDAETASEPDAVAKDESASD